MTRQTVTDAAPPLLVRAEGVLIATDVGWESFYLMLGRDPLLALRAPGWLKRGTGRLAAELVERFPPDAAGLPYHEPLLTYLREQRRLGRRLVLVTTLSLPFARKVADHLGLFDEVLYLGADAARPGPGDRGRGKDDRDRLPSTFAYAGRGADDPVAAEAVALVVVEPEPRHENDSSISPAVEKTFTSEPADWSTLAQAIRIHQWLKNLLLFVPLVTAHRIGEPALDLRAGCAFLSFSLCASAIYLLNDLVDLPADRNHPHKGGRPLAAGHLSVRTATLLVPLMTLAGIIIGLFLGPAYLTVLAAYIVLTTLYSFRLKSFVLVDVVVLAFLYIFRILAGSAAVGIMPSFWLLSFAMFIFFSLALMKRSADLLLGRNNGRDLMEGRGYMAGDAPIVQILGVASGALSVLVLALYVHSDDVRLLYDRPELIWLLCPLFFYWISRVWLLTSRGEMSDDPVLFTLRDRVSQGIAVLTAVILWLAT